MSNNHPPRDNYRPRSPDLSSFQPPPPSDLPKLNRLPSLPHQPDSGIPPGFSVSARGSYDASPYFSPQTSQASSYFTNQPQHPPALTASPPQYRATLPQTGSTPHHQQYSNLSSDHPVYPPQASGGPPRLPPGFESADPYDAAEMARLRNRKQINYNEDHHNVPLDEPPHASMPPLEPAFSGVLPPHPQMQFHQQQQQQQQQQPQLLHQQMPAQHFSQSIPPQAFPQQLAAAPVPAPAPGASSALISQIDVRTKFPVARIKRIMQADEDVGKVAQATPTAVSKALELFMIALVSKAAGEAKLQNAGKRITATHLKQALLKDSQFDFLNEICEGWPDESAGAAKKEKGTGKKGAAAAGGGGGTAEESD